MEVISKIKTAILGNSDKTIKFNEQNFIVKIIDGQDSDEVRKFQELRYKLRVVRYGWFASPREGVKLEYDEYDSHSVHFGVFDREGEINAYSRLILPAMHGGLQIFDEFESLLDPKLRPHWPLDNSAEVSALLVSEEFQHPVGYRHTIAQWLYKIMGQWSIVNKRRFWYAVAEKRFIRALRHQSFPFTIIGQGKLYKGALTHPAALDLEDAYKGLIQRDQDVYKWFVEGLDFKGKGHPPKIL